MSSPFDKRAIEKIRHDDAFLPYVAPAPFETHLKPSAENESLYDRLVVMTGTPGSGKTTMAQLFRVRTLMTLQRMAERNQELAELRSVLAACKAYDGVYPRIAGCRLSMEEKYRDCWECPYDENLRNKLLRSLINARAMLGWLQGFVDAGIPLERVQIATKKSVANAAEAISGESALAAYEHARQVEQAAYDVVAALVPPTLDEWPTILKAPYDAVDLVDRFVVKFDERESAVLPLLILDDAFWLNDAQQRFLIRWLAGREISIARWLLTRFDSFGARHILLGETVSSAISDASEPGIQVNRDITEIRLQGERSTGRTAFRKVARQLCNRYLDQIPIMHGRAATDLANMLEEQLVDVSKDQSRRAAALLDETIKRTAFPEAIVSDIKQQVEEYLQDHALRGKEAEVVGNAMVSILLNRQAKRTPQTTLFGTNEEEDGIEERIVRPSTSIEHGARIHLWHEAKIPYLYGFEPLADLANENTERFLDFAGQLVRLLQTRVIRSKTPRLSAQQQFATLYAHAEGTIAGWNFPESGAVRRIAAGMAAECVKKSLEPNASLGGGASAFGIPMDEFTKITDKYSDLARALQFGVAYNVFNLVQNHRTKGRDWCLIELCGPVLLANGLTLQRGGFLERRLSSLDEFRKGNEVARS